MRGIVLAGLQDFMREQYSMSTWQQILQKSDNEDLLVTAAEFYPDEQAINLVVIAAQHVQAELPEFIEAFGRHLFTTLREYYDFSVQDMHSLDHMLHSLDEVIHPQVKKLHPDAIVPTFRIENAASGWTVYYQSQRKLCPLAIGLIYGSAEHFQESIAVEHTSCMHDGHDECKFHVRRI